jgi:D-alanyl-D-alanine dipeptidase
MLAPAVALAAALAAAASPRAPAALVDAAGRIPDAVLDVRYATPANLTGRPLYPVARCLLLAPVAARLARAAERLRASGFRLVLYDCYRPLSVQRALWAAVPKVGYVADPATGSHHNRGAAVDLSLADLGGRPLAMPTDFDAFGPSARAGATAGLSMVVMRNRRRLREAMEAEGFAINPAEWWHFDAPEAAGAPLLDVPLTEAAR